MNGFRKLFGPVPKYQLCQVTGLDDVGNWMASVGCVSMESGMGFFNVIGTPHGDPLLAGFVKFQWTEAILIKKIKSCK